MRIQLIRHATLRLIINNKTILVDPVLSKKGTMPYIPNVSNRNRNPLVELPIDVNDIVRTDAVLLTHMHSDHFDETAARLLPKNIPIFCQSEDEVKVRQKEFYSVNPIEKDCCWNDIIFKRVGGQHGKGEVAKQMGIVSGYVIKTKNEPSLYITGDTVWCLEVEKALEIYNPELVVIFAGAAQLTEGGIPITMNKEDIFHICKKVPKSKVIVVHMEAWNHCSLMRKELRSFLKDNSLLGQVSIPKDGEYMEY
ncbi:MBL fold metallo-hydrolase [Clostridium ljungdahlii]|uniref:Metal-dependent hydrolase n=1 Tax=Clostridium ljungdahlii (strain ATCC 55383 / DSM 13528 / PETC) TaxID=748727 RepID=D8GMP0_CLOLD|nr:MBL fold metallo-hydrolase [Clostridium ljungdahlii]ADK15678.1 putative hydrolase [Clostridium ljungdahlii DSM 13528]OAA86561.1 metal-dependent hydrolase [Clostridium ljungdahlii DSM 13528]